MRHPILVLTALPLLFGCDIAKADSTAANRARERPARVCSGSDALAEMRRDNASLQKALNAAEKSATSAQQTCKQLTRDKARAEVALA